jgi:toxin ParE1/3/4
MGAPVILTDFAIQDPEDIVLFIAIDNPVRTRAFGHLLVDRALAVGNFPEMGRRIVPEFRDPGLREIIQGSYRIIYRIKQDPAGVFILRYWHAARGTPEIPSPHS